MGMFLPLNRPPESDEHGSVYIVLPQLKQQTKLRQLIDSEWLSLHDAAQKSKLMLSADRPAQHVRQRNRHIPHPTHGLRPVRGASHILPSTSSLQQLMVRGALITLVLVKTEIQEGSVSCLVTGGPLPTLLVTPGPPPPLAPATPGQQGLTQQEPQEPWSLISLMVGHCGHCSRASKFSGRAMSPASETLNKGRSPLKACTLPSVPPTPSHPYTKAS